ncbi:MAG TPA: PxKF domain-containing protein, partial [Jiangellaceae bacterium]|nr:PxKF domain-containing protein [Jiangellaceae bacterium]
LGGNLGLDILRSSHSPSSQQISCETLQPIQYAITTPTQKPGKTALTYNSARSRYQYLWETDAGWVGTCRQLIVTLNDGTQHRANFQFVAGDDQE